MIHSIIITDLDTAVSASFKETKQNAWISAVDEADQNKIRMIKKNFSQRGTPHFAQYFFDWSDEDNDVYIQKHIEEQGPQVQHVNSIISFIQPLIDSDKIFNLGVNCFAGVSRSTAIGIIAWVMQGKTPEQALREIIKVRYQAWPNLRMLRFASDRLKVDLIEPVTKWKKETGKELFTGGWS